MLIRSVAYDPIRPISGGVAEGGGWGFGLRNLFAAGEKGFAYTVDNLTKLWQDTAGTMPVTTVGQTVKRIDDLSGNGLHITNPTGWVLGQDSLGYYFLTADGASAFTAAISWSGTGLTLASAFNTIATPVANEYVIGLGNTGNATDFGGLRLLNTTGRAEFQAAGGLGTMSAIASTQGVPGDPHVTMGNTTGPTAYRDLTANTGTGSITSLATLNVLTIGALTRSVVTNFASGRFYGAVGVARACTDTELQNINNTLRVKFGTLGMFLAVGDSHTFNSSFGVVESDFYPRELSRLLGDNKLALNFGVSGDTTGNMIARLPEVLEAGAPEFAVIYGSTNDVSGETTVQASPAPTTTAFTVAATFGNRYGAGALITVNGVNAEVLSVATDRITVTAPLGFTPTAGQTVSLRTQANLVKIGQAIQASGCTRLIVPGLHYYNFASGLGDTTTTPNPSSAALRAAQMSAASALGAVHVDLYDWMRDLIVAGTYTQGDDTAWHVAVSDAHLNAVGEQILADAIFAAMQAQGWA